MADNINEDEILDSLLDSVDQGLSFDNFNDYSGQDEDDDIESILNSISGGQEASKNKNDTENKKDSENKKAKSTEEKKGKSSKLKKAKEDINKETKKKEKRKKKEKKKSSVSKNDISNDEFISEDDIDKIFNESGSTGEDMEDFVMPDESELLNELDFLASEGGSDDKKGKKKKEKKEKKEKKNKKSKEKLEKIKKPKPVVYDEKIYISPLMAILLLTIICLVIVTVYIGGIALNYNSKINKASSLYVDKNYDEAYDILSGMDLKGKDKGLYDQVVNIMRVKKHINDFNTYVKLDMNADALEALVRGVISYDGNIKKSNELGTTEILKSVLNDIDTMLNNYYGTNVDEVRTWIQMDNKADMASAINSKSLSFERSLSQ